MANSKKLLDYMTEWTFHYVKNKDILTKNIINIEKSDKELHVTFKNREEFYLILPSINNADEIIEKIKEKSYLTIVTLNSEENFKEILNNWKLFIDFQQFTIIFINPFSTTDTKWIISPYVHNKICDNASLKTGLKSMFNSVEPITEEQIQDLISNTRK